MKTKLLLFISIFAFVINGFSQQIWKQNTTGFQARIAENPKKYKSLTLDKKLFLSIVKNVSGRTSLKKKSSTILLPVENNTFEAFEILEAPNFSKELALKFPAIKSYVGKSTSSNKVARFSYSKYNGLTAFITTNNGTIMVKPTNLKANGYVAFNKSDSEPLSPFECGVTEKMRKVLNKNHAKAKTLSGDGYLRKYRLALATTGEYSNYFLTGIETSDAERKAVVLAALNTTLTRINGIFERDFGVTLELIPTNDRIIHLNASTDPFGGIGFSLLPVVQNHLDAEIGAANYDIGHVLARRFRNFGAAHVTVCVDGFPGKGSAFSSGPNLASDDFIVTVFAHELGHQLGTDHVQSSSSCRSIWEWDTAVEPGSGSTIMGYAGICHPNVQTSPDSYFNYVSIRDVKEFTAFKGCGELISTGNNTPTVNAGSNYTIPKSTPFSLEGSGDDVDNNSALTYTWEQNDPENPNSSSFPQPGWARGPLFRSLPPTDVPLRYIPKLEDVVSGNLTPTWEVLPSVSRTMDFVLTVRDNAAFGPKTASDEMTLTVDGSSGPFAVTSQNSSVDWEVGERRTITWNVANTNQAPINATTVAMYLSTDGGYTYPIEVATNVPNNGSYDIDVPEVSASTSRARLMVKAENNIFYSINASDLSIDLSGFLMRFSELEKDVCKGDEAVFVFNYKTFAGFNETTAFSVENLPNGVQATFSPPFAGNNNTAVNVTISGLENLDLGANELTVIGNTISKQRKIRLKLNLFENPDKPTLVSPENNALQIIPNSTLAWEADQNAEAYTIELATDPGFANIIEQTTTTESTFTPSQTEFYTSYYWRVKSENECRISNFSEVFTFKTSCKDPANVTITDITHQSATISWTDDFSSDWEIRIIENAPIPVERVIATSTNSNIISALNSSTDYDVFVRSLCASDFSSWMGPEKFTTPVSCPAPSDFVVDDITSGVVNLSWTSNGSETAWELEYGLEGFTPGTGTKVLATTNPYALEGLDAGLNYDVYLTAICGSNSGDDDSFIIGPVQFNIPINYCEVGKFYDPGGPGGNYGENERFIEEITSPGENIPLTVAFNAFDLAEGDYMWISGPDINDNLGIYHGTDSPGTITSEIGRITFRFFATDSETSAGWDATVICGPLSCPMPSDFVADNTTANTVDLSWTSNGSEPQWELEYGVAGFVQGQGTRVLTSTNLHSLTGLSADTDYRVYLKAICSTNSGDDDSPWVGPLDFTTLASCPAPSDFVVDNTTANTVDLSWTSNGSEAQWELEYGVAGFVQGQGARVLTSTNPHSLAGLSAGTDYRVYLKAICGTNSGDDDSSWVGPLDFTTLASCPAPSDFVVDDITSDVVNLSWTRNGSEAQWELEYGLEGFAPGTGTKVLTATNPYALEGLYAGVNYEVYLKAICGSNPGDDDSFIIGPVRFKIPINDYCEAGRFYDNGGPEGNYREGLFVEVISSPGENIPLTVAFNTFDLAEGATLNIYRPGFLRETYSGTDSPGTITSEIGELTFRFYSDGSETSAGWDATVICGALSCPMPSDFVADNTTANTVDLSWTSNGSEPQWELEYGVAGFVQGQGTRVLTSTNLHSLTGLSADTDYRVYLKAICSTNSGDDDSPWVGPLDFTTPASCPAPSDFVVDDITSDVVNLSWTSNGSEPQWELEYGVAGFVQGQGTRVLTSTNPHSLAGLSAGTDYRVYLKAICGTNSGDDDSSWVGPLDFTTLASCPAPSDFVVDDITSDVVNLSWTRNGSEAQWELEYGLEGFAPGTGTKVLTATNPYALEGLYAGVNYEVYLKAICGSNPGDDDSFIIGPVQFNIPINYCEVGKFYDPGGPGGNYGENERFIEEITSPGENIPLTVAFNAFDLAEGDYMWISGPDINNNLGIYRGTDSPGTITSEIGRITFRFFATDSETSAGWDATVICGALSCPMPSDFVADNTTANTVDLSWTSNGSEPQWELEYGVAGFVQGQGTRVLTSTNLHSLTGLSAGTDYRVYLKAICGTNSGDDDSPWVGPLDFTTLASCPAPSDFVVDDITSDVVNLSWTSNGSEAQWELEYGLEGFAPGTGTKVVTSTNPHSLAGLSEDTNYEIYLKAVCDPNSEDDDSPWVGPLDFVLIGPLGNSEVSIDRFEYYPNPVNNKLIIESNEEITKIEVYNSVGQLISVKQDKFKERTEIDFSDLSPGIYHIQCFSYDKQQPFNIIKK